jgi:TolA-binding protein
MMPPKYLFLLPVVLTALQGCGADNSVEIASLQKQVAALTRQVEETRKQMETVEETNKKLNTLLDSLETEVDRLQAREIPIPAPAPRPGSERSPSAAAAPQRTLKVPCSQVWKLIGLGKSEAAVAKELDTTVEAVRSCEQEVGRRGGG